MREREEKKTNISHLSTTSTPRAKEDKFKPQRGKVNRQSNWQRFGEFESGQRGGGRGNRPQFYSPQNNRGSQNPSQSKLHMRFQHSDVSKFTAMKRHSLQMNF